MRIIELIKTPMEHLGVGMSMKKKLNTHERWRIDNCN